MDAESGLGRDVTVDKRTDTASASKRAVCGSSKPGNHLPRGNGSRGFQILSGGWKKHCIDQHEPRWVGTCDPGSAARWCLYARLTVVFCGAMQDEYLNVSTLEERLQNVARRMVTRNPGVGGGPGGMPASTGQMQQVGGNPNYGMNQNMPHSLPNRQQVHTGSAGAVMSNGAPVMRRGSNGPMSGPASYQQGLVQVSDLATSRHHRIKLAERGRVVLCSDIFSLPCSREAE